MSNPFWKTCFQRIQTFKTRENRDNDEDSMTFRGSDIENGSWDSRLLLSCAKHHYAYILLHQRHGRSTGVLTILQAVVFGSIRPKLRVKMLRRLRKKDTGQVNDRKTFLVCRSYRI